LLGQTLDGMRVWDVVRAAQAVRAIESLSALPLELTATSNSGIALYASLFIPDVDRVSLVLPESHREGPDLLNVRRFFDLPQAVALAADRSPIECVQSPGEDWQYPKRLAEQLGWSADRLEFIRPGD
jgi:hypothetical protein